MSDSTTESERFEKKLREHCDIDYCECHGEEKVNSHLSAVMIAFDEYLKGDDDTAKANDEIKDQASGVRVNALVSLLKERKNHYSEKSERLLLSDKDEHERDEFKDAVFMYGNYVNVIADIRSHLKEKAG